MSYNIHSMAWAFAAMNMPRVDKEHLPTEGHPPVTATHRKAGPVVVWVKSKLEKDLSGSWSRVMARCPACGKVTNAGKFDQHFGTATCVLRAYERALTKELPNV